MDNKHKELLRFITAGSVDDGKSTLIGRLLYDSKSLMKDQYEAALKTSQKRGVEGLDFSLITDGLKDEREQGITIDVAYHYFSTPKRKYIIADTPGHIQYTRNMVTGASTANLAIVLIDVRHGIVEQTKRHTFIASLLQIPHLIVCINKMDLVEYGEFKFNKIVEDFEDFVAKMMIKDVRFIPISALQGDNVVNPSKHMPWYTGRALLDTLDTIHISSDLNLTDGRFAVQTVIRPQIDEFRDYRGYAGQISSGIYRKGEDIVVLPSGIESKIKSIYTYDGELDEAFSPQSVTINLEDDIDISRGDMIVKKNNRPTQSKEFDVMICWFNNKAHHSKAKYYLKHTTKEVKAKIIEVKYKVDVNTLKRNEIDKSLSLNDIARVTIKTAEPLFYDEYRNNRITGSLILINSTTNETVAAAMIHH